MAVLKARKQPFLIGGSLGLSFHLDRLVPGELEILLRADQGDPVLAGLETAGFKVDRIDDQPRARVRFGEHTVVVAWGLAPPLGAPIDEPWFTASFRARLLDLRVRIAPLEELIWERIAMGGGASLGDADVQDALLHAGATLDWDRLLARMIGLEALLLAHVFLLYHRASESARAAFPARVVATLLERVKWRMNANASTSVEAPVH